MTLSRREFLKSSALLCFSLKGLPLFGEEVAESNEIPAVQEVFPQGVCAGDPTQSSVILWTRINPEVKKREVKLLLQEEDGSEVLRTTLYPSSRRDYTLRVFLEGLRPGRAYLYTFSCGGVEARGRFRTLPRETERLRLSFVCCQNYENGYYPAYRHIAEEDLDLVLFLGDRIYERIYGDSIRPLQPALPSGSNVVLSLEDYRYLYRLYLSDENYRLARAMHPFVYLWDDHEFANDYAYDYERKIYRLPGHLYDGDEKLTRKLREAAVRAWLEYTPADVRYTKRGPKMYRSFAMGSLAEIVCTDERSYRDLQPYYGRKPRTMLGEEQKAWFKERFKEKREWFVWASEVLFSPLYLGGKPLRLDSWNGYEEERRELLGFFSEHLDGNLLVLSGDRHAAMVCELREGERLLGAEFMTPALSSMNLLEKYRRKKRGLPAQIQEKLEMKENLNVRWVNHQMWGYALLEINPREARAEYYFVDKNFPGSPKRKVKEFLYQKGKELISS